MVEIPFNKTHSASSEDSSDTALDGMVLRVRGLTAAFDTESGRVRAVENLSFSLREGHLLGIVGESGCGKSVTALSIMRLLPRPDGHIESGEVWFKGRDLLQLSAGQMHKIRGNRISMIFQEPMTALNPVHRVGDQIREVYRLHFPQMKPADMTLKAMDAMKRVGIPDPEARLSDYPHQLSGGMRQRVMIAMALASNPDILIADEPTTALDVTIQAQILEQIQDIQAQTGMSVIFITHDLGVVAQICHDVVVMYAGKVAETATVKDLFNQPCHPYTQALLASIPRLELTPKTPLHVIAGMVPTPGNMPSGCRFNNRCPFVMKICPEIEPPLFEPTPGHFVACHLYDQKEQIG
jgi:oligopeptide/dipeptide ABC transporter ATP-binding protein